MVRSFNDATIKFRIDEIVSFVEAIKGIYHYEYQVDIFHYSFLFGDNQFQRFVTNTLFKIKTYRDEDAIANAIYFMQMEAMWVFKLDYSDDYSNDTLGDGACLLNSSFQLANKESGRNWCKVELPKNYWANDFQQLLAFARNNQITGSQAFDSFQTTLEVWNYERNKKTHTFAYDESFGYYFQFQKYYNVDINEIPKITLFMDDAEQGKAISATKSKKKTSGNKKRLQMRLHRTFPNIDEDGNLDWKDPSLLKTSWTLQQIIDALKANDYVVLANEHFFQPKVNGQNLSLQVQKHINAIKQQIQDKFSDAVSKAMNLSTIEFNYSIDVAKAHVVNNQEKEFRK